MSVVVLFGIIVFAVSGSGPKKGYSNKTYSADIHDFTK
jgi:hypothetical protein